MAVARELDGDAPAARAELDDRPGRALARQDVERDVVVDAGAPAVVERPESLVGLAARCCCSCVAHAVEWLFRRRRRRVGGRRPRRGSGAVTESPRADGSPKFTSRAGRDAAERAEARGAGTAQAGWYRGGALPRPCIDAGMSMEDAASLERQGREQLERATHGRGARGRTRRGARALERADARAARARRAARRAARGARPGAEPRARRARAAARPPARAARGARARRRAAHRGGRRHAAGRSRCRAARRTC